MAREIIVTSVQRGIFAGQTGFQVVMRTAGLRDDVTKTLEGLAVYRHLPPGVGPNPERLFHQFVQTAAGRFWVLGRVVDAGSDYSNRSNKLAHLIAIEEAELGPLRSSSPAAVLQHVAPRLSRTWARGPEQRSEPFDLSGMPVVMGNVCSGWERALGDAGWAGVLAERAQHGQATLVIGVDSSPVACQQMLDLFEESLALLPPASRWGVTFDTSIMSAAPVLWRGTYPGSPESSQRQPGVLLVDLARRLPVPAELQASPLVKLAREGATHRTTSSGETRGAGQSSGSKQLPESGAMVRSGSPQADNWPRGGDEPPLRMGSWQRTQRPTEVDDEEELEVQPRSPLFWPAVIASVLAVVGVGVTGLLFGGAMGLEWWRNLQATRVVEAWADGKAGEAPAGAEEPTEDDWRRRWRRAAIDQPNPGPGQNEPSHESKSLGDLPALLPLINSALLMEKVTKETLATRAGIEKLLAAAQRLRDGDATVDDFRCVGVSLGEGEQQEQTDVAKLLVEVLARERRAGQTITSVKEANDVAQGIADIVSLAYRIDDTPVGIAATGLQRVLGDKDGSRAVRIAGLLGQVKRNARSQEAVTTLPGLEKLALALEAVVQGKAKVSDYSAIGLVLPEVDEEATKAVARWNALAKEKSGAVTVAGLESQFNADKAATDEAAEKNKAAKIKQEAASNELRRRLSSGTPIRWPEPGQKQRVIAMEKAAANDLAAAVEVRLGQVPGWSTKAVKTVGTVAGVTEWSLSGLPGNPNQSWGTLRISGTNEGEGVAEIWFEAAHDAPRSSGAVPIVLALRGGQGDAVWFRFEPQNVTWAEGPTLLELLAPTAETNPQAKLRTVAWPPELATVAESCKMELRQPKSVSVRPNVTVQAEGGGRLIVVYKDTVGDKQPTELTLIEELTWTFDAKEGDVSLSCVEQGWRARSTRWGMKNPPVFPKTLLIDQASWITAVSAVLRNVIGDDEVQSCDLRRRLGAPISADEDRRKLLNSRLTEAETSRGTLETRLEETRTRLRNAEGVINMPKDPKAPPKQAAEHDLNVAQAKQTKATLVPEVAALTSDLAKAVSKVTKLQERIAEGTTSPEDLQAMAAWPPVGKGLVRAASGPTGWRQEPMAFLANSDSSFAKGLVAHGKSEEDIKSLVHDVEFLHQYRRDHKNDFERIARQDWSKPADAARDQNQVQNECLAIHLLVDLDGLMLAQMRKENLETAFAVPLAGLLEATVRMEWQVPNGPKLPSVPVIQCAEKPVVKSADTTPSVNPKKTDISP